MRARVWCTGGGSAAHGENGEAGPRREGWERGTAALPSARRPGVVAPPQPESKSAGRRLGPGVAPLGGRGIRAPLSQAPPRRASGAALSRLQRVLQRRPACPAPKASPRARRAPPPAPPLHGPGQGALLGAPANVSWGGAASAPGRRSPGRASEESTRTEGRSGALLGLAEHLPPLCAAPGGPPARPHARALRRARPALLERRLAHLLASRWDEEEKRYLLERLGCRNRTRGSDWRTGCSPAPSPPSGYTPPSAGRRALGARVPALELREGLTAARRRQCLHSPEPRRSRRTLSGFEGALRAGETACRLLLVAPVKAGRERGGGAGLACPASSTRP